MTIWQPLNPQLRKGQNQMLIQNPVKRERKVPSPKVSLVKLPKMTLTERVNLLRGNRAEQEAID